MDFSRNQLSGSLPSSFGECRNMQWFDVRHNLLSGSIPNISSWTRLKRAAFNGNENLHGHFPSSLCSNTAGIVQLPSDVMVEVQFSVDCDTVTCDCCAECNPVSNVTGTDEPQNRENSTAIPAHDNVRSNNTLSKNETPAINGNSGRPSFGGQVLMSRSGNSNGEGGRRRRGLRLPCED